MKLIRLNKKAVSLGNIVIVIALIVFMLYAIFLKLSAAVDFPDTNDDVKAISNAYHSYVSLDTIVQDIANYSYEFALFDYAQNGALSDLDKSIYQSDNQKYLGHNKWIYYSDALENDKGLEEEIETTESNFKIASPLYCSVAVYFDDYFNQYMQNIQKIYPDYIFSNSSFSAKVKKNKDSYGVLLSGNSALSIALFDSSMSYDSFNNLNSELNTPYVSSIFDSDLESISLLSPLSLDYKFKIWPTKSNVITSCFGNRYAYVKNYAGASYCHGGIDIRGSANTPVYAVESGVVDIVRTTGSFHYVRIKHDNGLYTRYGHVEPYNIQEGASVEAGQQIARIQNLGSSSHLHFEVNVNSEILDILQYSDDDICNSKDINSNAILRNLGNDFYSLDPLAFFDSSLKLSKKSYSNCQELSDLDIADRASRYYFLLPSSEKKVCIVSNADFSEVEQQEFSNVLSYDVSYLNDMPLISDDCDYTVYLYETNNENPVSIYYNYKMTESMDFLCDLFNNQKISNSNVCSVTNLDNFPPIDKLQIDNANKFLGISYSSSYLKNNDLALLNVFTSLNKALYQRFTELPLVESGKTSSQQLTGKSPESDEKTTTISGSDFNWDLYAKEKSTLFYRYNFDIVSDFNFSIVDDLLDHANKIASQCLDKQDIGVCINNYVDDKKLNDNYHFDINPILEDLTQTNMDYITKLYESKLHLESSRLLAQLIACYDSDDLFCSCTIKSDAEFELDYQFNKVKFKYNNIPDEFASLSDELKQKLLDIDSTYDLSYFGIEQLIDSPNSINIQSDDVMLKIFDNKLHKYQGLESTKFSEVQECNIDQTNFLVSQLSEKSINYEDKALNIELNPLFIYAIELKNNVSPLDPDFIVEDMPKAEDSVLLKINKIASTDINRYQIYVGDELRYEINRDYNILYDDQINELAFDKSKTHFIFDLSDVKRMNIASYSYTEFDIDQNNFVDYTGILQKDHLYVIEDDENLEYLVVVNNVEDGEEHEISVVAIDNDELLSISDKKITPVDDLSPGKPSISSLFGDINVIPSTINEDNSENSEHFISDGFEWYISKPILGGECSENLEQYAIVQKQGSSLNFANYQNVVESLFGISLLGFTETLDYCIAVVQKDEANNPKKSNYDDESYYNDLIVTQKMSYSQSFLG